MSLIAAGVIFLASSAVGVASAVEQRSDAKKREENEERISAAEEENAVYARALEERRRVDSKQYEPGYALLADELKDRPILAEEAIPLTGSIVAAEDLFRKQDPVAPDVTGAAPGTARAAAIDLGSTGHAAQQIVQNTQELQPSLEMQEFRKRKQAIDLGKQYVGS